MSMTFDQLIKAAAGPARPKAPWMKDKPKTAAAEKPDTATTDSMESNQGSVARGDNAVSAVPETLGNNDRESGLPTPLRERAKNARPPMPFKRNRPSIPGVDKGNLLSLISNASL